MTLPKVVLGVSKLVPISRSALEKSLIAESAFVTLLLNVNLLDVSVQTIRLRERLFALIAREHLLG